MTKYTDTFYRIATRAFLRNGDIEHTDDALMLALLLHCSGVGRESSDEKYVRKIMKDQNLED